MLVLLMTVMTASAIDVPTYNLTVGTNDHGTVKFYVAETEVTKAPEGATVTVVITPNTGWVVNQPSGQWYAAVAAARSQRTASVDLLDKVTLTPVEGQTNQWTFTMARANVEISSTYKKLLTNTDITIVDISALTYSGVSQTPTVTVKDGNTELVLNTDYTVSYSNNVNAALSTAAQNAPTVTITAVGNSQKYAGETTKTFTINKKALTVTADNKSVTFGDDAPTYTETYDGFVNNETKAVLGGTLTLTCSYVKNQTGAGNYDITPSGLTSSNYDITFTKGTLTVGKKALEDGFIANIASLVYNGVAQEPAPVVTFNGMTLVKGTDYSVSYENNVNVGTATATVTALANSTKYSGSASKTFSITKKALTVTADNKSVTFGDDAPAYTVSYDGFVNNETNAVLGGTLALACDYVKDQSGAGNYDITPSGLTSSNYDITFTKGTLTVGKKALEDGFIANIASLVYNGVAQEPAPVVTFNGMTLVKGTDYSVSYENNVNVGTATATVTALANSTKYSGSASKTFSITKKALTVKADNKSVTYGDEAPQYTVSYDGFVNNETKAVLGGTLSLTCSYVKNQSGVGTYDITPSGYTSDNYDITFTNGTLTVGTKALENSFIADIDALTYTSEAQTPAPVLTFHEMTLAAGTDYTVAYSNNTNAGTATVTCTGQGNYSGQAQKTFTINPATLTSVTLAQTEFMYNLYDPQPQTAEIDVVKAGDLIVPVEGYDVEGNTQTDVNTYTVKVTGKTNFTGTVTADFVIKDTEVPGTAAETESGEEVDDVTMVLTVADRTEQTLNIENISEGTPNAEGIVVEIPATVNGWKVKTVSANAMANLSNVTDIYLPDTEETAIEVADNALETADGMAVVHAPLQLLDNYAQLLPAHVSNKKVVSDVTQTAKRFWSFSCGVNVELPEGLTANIVLANTETQVTSDPIKGSVVKANNGVLLEGTQGVEYQLTALPATSVGNDYANNLMVPVVEKKHFAYGQGYYILKSGQFYAIANDAAEVPSCKAVMHIAGARARVITIDFDEATGITGISGNTGISGDLYDLNGRKVTAPTKKGLYIMNGKKVVVK